MDSATTHTTADDAHDELRRLRADARTWIRRQRLLYTILGIYAALSLMWFAIDLADDSSGYWFYWPMLGVGVGVAITAIVLLGVGGVFGADWERRQLDRYMRQHDARHLGDPPGSTPLGSS